MIRTRFAPSPTGFLHIGGLRTALYSYLVAKQNGGKFLLRVEDTDQKRYVEGGIENILKSLEWAGIVPDEGVILNGEGKPIDKGDKGPYIQSQRLDIYREYAKQLVKEGHAYYCFCSPERLEKFRNEQQRRGLPTGYDGHCRKLTKEEATKKFNEKHPFVIRMKMPREGETIFNDLIRGEVRFKNELIDDQVIVKSDGFPTYHLAVVVDDYLMEISHVIRGEEWLSSTPKHLQLYKYFGWEPPRYAHLPLILNPDKTKLSKRQGDISVEDCRVKGYLPEALVNFIALLGWNPGTERELFTVDKLVKEFSLEKINKSGAVFNLEKLNWMNKQYIKTLNDAELVKRAKPFFETAQIEDGDKRYEIGDMSKILKLEKERVDTLSELPKALAFVFSLPDYPPGMLVWKKSNKEEAKNILRELIEELNNFGVQDWKSASLEQKIKAWIEQKKYSNGVALWPMRVALSGQEKSPPPFEIAEVLGKEEAVKRLRTALTKLK